MKQFDPSKTISYTNPTFVRMYFFKGGYMKTGLKIFSALLLLILIGLTALIIIKVIDVKKGKSLAQLEYTNTLCKPFNHVGSVEKLTILPVIRLFC